MKKIDFFLSHNRAEKDWTRKLNSALKNRGATTFFDEDSIAFGEDIVLAISNALKISTYVVLVLSPRSVGNRWVELEWSSAAYADTESQARRLVPVLKEDCDFPFLLKRLRYVDARNCGIEEVATSLVTLISHQESEIRPPKNEARSVAFANPLRFGAPQYVIRKEDSDVDAAMRKGQSVLIYGPRMVGKTSMLYQIAAKAALSGDFSIRLDLQAYATDDPVSILEGVGHDVAQALNSTWATGGGSAATRLYRLLADYASKKGRMPILLLDECDVITHHPGGHALGNVLRSIIARDKITCVAAGFQPKWKLGDSGPLSPWWDPFYSVRLGPFNREEVAQFCEWLSEDARTNADALWTVTGGHPALVAIAGYAHSKGQPLAKMLADPLDPRGPFAEFVWVLGELSKNTELMRALRDGRTIPKEDREALWIRGIVNDPRVNPPVINGVFFRELISQLAEE